MGTKYKKYSTHQISELLNSQSDTDTTDEIVKTTNKPRKRGRPRLQSKDKDIDDDASDMENMYDRVKNVLLRKNALQHEKVSLKIRLRRSTEQSMYKIDTDSDCERPTRKPPKNVTKNMRRISSDTESDISCSSNKNSSVKENAKELVLSTPPQDENVMPQRSSRTRRPPLRLSYYHCSTLPSLDNSANTPILRNRSTINYNEESLYARNEKINKDLEQKSMVSNISKKSTNYSSDSSTATHKSDSKILSSTVRNNKRNRTPSVRENENDGDVVSKVTEPKSSRKSNAAFNKSDNLDSPRTRVNVRDKTMRREQPLNPASLDSTPVRREKHKKSTSESKEKQRDPKASESEEESLADMYKRLKVTTAKRNVLTPQKRNNAQENSDVQIDNNYPRTPKSRVLKCSNLTPSLEKRSNALLKPSTPLQEARSRLHVSAVPKSLPCREEEFNCIFTFLKGKLVDKSGGCIYISGVPGTGKTATVNEVVRCLQKLISKGEVNNFDYIAINGMKLTEPRQAYVQILKQLTGQTLTWEQAYRTLEKRFHSTTSKMTLLLVDELDFLCTKRQDVVYNLLDWPTKASAQLVVITIANTMDLPERVLMGRVTSRLGLTRLTFQPYNYKQLQEIVTSRLKNFNSFRSEAIQLVARKVSAVSGDARRALDICRRAMEIAELRKAETISLLDVSEAVSEMIATAKIQAIMYCSEIEKIFLQSVSAEVTRTAVEEVSFRSAYKQFESICSFNGVKIPTVTEALGVCSRLGASRLLICEHSRNDIYQKILLNVSTDDIYYALQQSVID